MWTCESPAANQDHELCYITQKFGKFRLFLGKVNITSRISKQASNIKRHPHPTVSESSAQTLNMPPSPNQCAPKSVLHPWQVHLATLLTQLTWYSFTLGFVRQKKKSHVKLLSANCPNFITLNRILWASATLSISTLTFQLVAWSPAPCDH